MLLQSVLFFFCNAPFWDTVFAIAGALVGTAATYWGLTSSLPSLEILALMFLSQTVVFGFLGGFLAPEGMFAGLSLNLGTIVLGIVSRYTTLSRQKTLLIFVVFVALFVPVWAADFWRRNPN